MVSPVSLCPAYSEYYLPSLLLLVIVSHIALLCWIEFLWLWTNFCISYFFGPLALHFYKLPTCHWVCCLLIINLYGFFENAGFSLSLVGISHSIFPLFSGVVLILFHVIYTLKLIVLWFVLCNFKKFSNPNSQSFLFSSIML